MTLAAFVLVAFGVIAVVVGISLIFMPAGLIAAGIVLAAAGYAIRYVEVHDT